MEIYQFNMPIEQVFEIQRLPGMLWLKQKYSAYITKKEVKAYYSYLANLCPIHNADITLKITDRGCVPKCVSADPQLGIALIWVSERRAEIHMAIKNRPLYRTLDLLAHEYRHCQQMLELGLEKEETHPLELDAIDFAAGETLVYAMNYLRRD